MKKQLHQKQIWDINSGFFGVPVNELMEEAGKQVAEKCAYVECRGASDVNGPFLILVGPGNNGGDGLVCVHGIYMKLDAKYLWY